MSILNNLKDFFIPAEVEEESDSSYKQEKQEPEKDTAPVSSVSSSQSSYGSSSQRDDRRSTSSSYSSSMSTASSARVSFSGTPTLQVILVKPTEYTDAKKIADHLMGGKTVVMVLEDATEQTRRRIIDFLIGVAYAMNGNLKPIANQTYIVTPHDVGLVDQLVSELGKTYTGAQTDAPSLL